MQKHYLDIRVIFSRTEEIAVDSLMFVLFPTFTKNL